MNEMKRIVLGGRNVRDKPSVILHNGIVVETDSSGYVFALGWKRDKFIAWLSYNKVPWHCFGYKWRGTDNANIRLHPIVDKR